MQHGFAHWTGVQIKFYDQTMARWRSAHKQIQTAPADAAGRCRVACEDLVVGRPAGEFTGIEASSLRQLFRIHALGGLAVRAIELGTLRLPEGVAAGIHQDFAVACGLVSRLNEECTSLGKAAVDAVGCAPVRASLPILLKGPSVALRYTEPALRTYLDIDRLVRPEELPFWAQVLRELGYRAPEPEVRTASRRYQEGVSFVRRAGGQVVSCDVHACLFIERRARQVTYGSLLANSELSSFEGLLQPTLAAEIVILALHLAHHPTGSWRLIWLRDLIELGMGDAVPPARELAVALGVDWALERALFATQIVLGYSAWNASEPSPSPFGLASVHQGDVTHYLRHLALLYELGPFAGSYYLASRLDPRRFCAPSGQVDWTAFRQWFRSVSRRTFATPWGAALRRRN